MFLLAVSDQLCNVHLRHYIELMAQFVPALIQDDVLDAVL
jgi:hypothetical protein